MDAPTPDLLELKLLTAQDLAALWQVDESTVYRRMQKGEIPTVKIGRAVRVRAADAMQFINAQLGA